MISPPIAGTSVIAVCDRVNLAPMLPIIITYAMLSTRQFVINSAIIAFNCLSFLVIELKLLFK